MKDLFVEKDSTKDIFVVFKLLSNQNLPQTMSKLGCFLQLFIDIPPDGLGLAKHKEIIFFRGRRITMKCKNGFPIFAFDHLYFGVIIPERTDINMTLLSSKVDLIRLLWYGSTSNFMFDVIFPSYLE